MTTIEWKNKESVISHLRGMNRVFREELELAMDLSAEILVGATIEGTPVADGILASSIHHSGVIQDAGGMRVEIGDSTPYGEVIAKGRKPGSRMPPVEALIGWVWSHRTYFDDVETESDAKGIAFLIARNIARRGFASAPDGEGKGWDMYAKALEAKEDEIMAIFERAKRRIGTRLSTG